ncbi:MAG: putative protease [Chloroflexi bacterium]|nr:putative protease [Chloroflexota bacterium]
MPEEIPLFPLNTVLFPGMPLPLHIFEPRYREMIALCSEEKRPFGVVLIREGMEVGEAAKPFDVGTMAKIIGVDRLEDGRLNIVTVGTRRFRLVNYYTDRQSYVVGDVEILDDQSEHSEDASQLARDVGAMAQRYVAMVQAASEQELTPLELTANPEEISYVLGATLRIRNRERQRILEAGSTIERLQLEKAIFERESATIEDFLKRRKAGNLGPFSRN